MVVSVAQATQTRTQTSILAQMYADASILGVDVVGVQAEALFRALYELESRAKRSETDIRVAVALSGFLDTSTGPWLTLLARGVFALARVPPTRAVRALRVVSSLLTPAGTIPARQMLVQTTIGSKAIRYRNVNDISLLPSSTIGPVLFESVELGSSGNLPTGTSFTLVSQVAGVSLIDNGFGTTGTQLAIDEENDASLRKRCRAQWPATALWGTRLAFARYIQEAFDTAGLPNTITRFAIDDANPNGPGSYDLYIANQTSASLTSEVPAATGAEISTVFGYFTSIEKAGSGPVRVFAAATRLIALSVFLKGSTATANAQALLVSMAAGIQPGGIVYRSEVFGTLNPAPAGLSDVLPGLYDMNVNSPEEDVQLAFNEIPIWSPITITGGP